MFNTGVYLAKLVCHSTQNVINNFDSHGLLQRNVALAECSSEV